MKMLHDVLHEKQYDNLDRAIEYLWCIYNQEHTANELRKPLVSRLEYNDRELELTQLENYILILTEIKHTRENENRQKGI